MSNLYRPGPCLVCGAPDSRRYVNHHYCPTHAPQNPTPDPARTLAGLRAAAGIAPPPLAEHHGPRTLRRRLDRTTPTDLDLGTITPDDSGNVIWRCGLCAVEGWTSPKAAPVALLAHLQYRHPNRAAKVAERAAQDQPAPVDGVTSNDGGDP